MYWSQTLSAHKFKSVSNFEAQSGCHSEWGGLSLSFGLVPFTVSESQAKIVWWKKPLIRKLLKFEHGDADEGEVLCFFENVREYKPKGSVRQRMFCRLNDFKTLCCLNCSTNGNLQKFRVQVQSRTYFLTKINREKFRPSQISRWVYHRVWVWETKKLFLFLLWRPVLWYQLGKRYCKSNILYWTLHRPHFSHLPLSACECQTLFWCSVLGAQVCHSGRWSFLELMLSHLPCVWIWRESIKENAPSVETIVMWAWGTKDDYFSGVGFGK